MNTYVLVAVIALVVVVVWHVCMRSYFRQKREHLRMLMPDFKNEEKEK